MAKSEHPLIVIGHKNPDTDSICSAIAYAHLKSDFLGEEATPFRAGSLNPQTSFVLSHFEVESPSLLTDVYPKIDDIMVRGEDLITLKEEDTLAYAQEIIVKNGFSFLPVEDSEGKCAGKITSLKLAGLTEEIASLPQRDSITIDFGELVESLEGKVLTNTPPPSNFSGRLFIRGVSEEDGLDRAKSPIFITSIDEGVITAAIEKGAKIIAICGGKEAGAKVVELADKTGVCLVSSPKDILAAAVNVGLAMPIKDFIDRDHTTFKHYDLVRDVQKEIGNYNEGGFIVLDDGGFTRGVIARISFLESNKFRVAMVDHNELTQAVDGLEEAEIIEIIDHHRLGNRNTDSPITFINKTVGSTCTIISELFRNFGYTPDPPVAGLMLSAILSDTVILKSPTTTEIDKEMSAWLASEAGVDIEDYGKEMFAAGSALEGVDPDTILKQDQKTFVEGDWKFSLSQIEMVGFGKFYEMKDALAEKLESFLAKEGCNFGCLIATDITEETSLLLCSGGEKIVDTITYPEVEKNIYEMRGVLSRKKQVLPYLLDLIRKL